MGRPERRALISEIERLRGTRLLCYVTSDRSPIGGMIYEDAIRPFYGQLRELGHVPKVDLFLYSRGGAVEVPWRLAHGLRQAAGEWAVLVPWRANSSATLLCLGADQIVFGRHGELGPIDTSWSWRRVAPPGSGTGPTVSTDNVSIEDVMAYVQFVREHWALSSQTALASALEKLTERIDAVQLGSIYRSKTHIQENARHIIASRNAPPDELTLQRIVETLAEQIHAHNHAIALDDARALGLPAESAAPEVESLMWRLFEDFEEEMKIMRPIDPTSVVTTTDLYEEEALVVAIESARSADHLTGRIEVRAKRNLPVGLVINVTVDVPPPSSPDADQDDVAWVEILNKLRATAVLASVQAVHATVGNYGVVAAESAFRGAAWKHLP